MDTNKLRIFLKILEAGSLTGAAESTGYTTSGISRIVLSLEEETGFPLLSRSRSGIVPTEECLKLLPVMEEIMRSVEKYEQTADHIRGIETGSVTIGTAYLSYYPMLAEIIANFSRDYPGITVKIVEENSSILVDMLEQQKVDFCIITKRPGSFRWHHLQKDALHAWVCADHPAVEDGCYDIRRFDTDSFIELFPGQQETDNAQFFRANDIRPNVKYSTSHVEAAYSMVKAGLGVTLVNHFFIKKNDPDVTALPLRPASELSIGIALQQEKVMSPAARCFWKYMENMFDEI